MSDAPDWSIADALDAQFGASSSTVQDADWHPDVRTLQWLLHRLDAALIGEAVRLDVDARKKSVGSADDMATWYFVADAAIEAIIFPAIRAASG